jgi:hypothetical protein
MTLALPFALASQHLPELARMWSFVGRPPFEPDAAIRPAECRPYVEELEHTAKLIATCSFFIIVGISLLFVVFLPFTVWNLKNEEGKFIKRLAKATPEEREELLRICREANIKVERRETRRCEKIDDLQGVCLALPMSHQTKGYYSVWNR